MIHDSIVWTCVLVALIACLLPAQAHDMPNDATVRIFLKPEGRRLQILARVPLQTIRDVDFPSRPEGSLDIDRLAPLLPALAKIWIADNLEIFEGSEKLIRLPSAETQISLQSDRSFSSFDEALRRIRGSPLTDRVNWTQVQFDARFEYPIQSDRSAFSLHSKLQGLAGNVVTVLQFLPPGGETRAFQFTGDPGTIALDPSWHQAAWQFLKLGFEHILDGTDHLLFLLCLVIPFRQFRSLLIVVTAFTVAHSITLAAATFQLAPDALWFPPLVETLIAASIFYMALENIVGAGSARRRWIAAFAFGLIHGFGFSFALRETLQFAGSHLVASLLWFNIGVELGQILVLFVLIPVLDALFRHVVAERMGTIILSTIVAHTAWHWMIERWDILRQFRFEMPPLSAALLVSATQFAILVVGVAFVVWLLRQRRRSEHPTQ
jgi:hypothetical protein